MHKENVSSQISETQANPNNRKTFILDIF